MKIMGSQYFDSKNKLEFKKVCSPKKIEGEKEAEKLFHQYADSQIEREDSIKELG